MICSTEKNILHYYIYINTNTYFVPLPSENLVFQLQLSWSFFMFSDLRREAIADFVDIDGIVDNNFWILIPYESYDIN